VGRLREAIRRLNPAIPEEAREEALRKVLRVGTPSLTQTNRAFHRMLRDGVPVEYPRPDGSIAGDHVRLVDFGDVRANDWLAVNQFTVIEGQHNRRPDIVVFVNGLPLGLIELKNAADEDATIWSAYAQLQTYKAEIPSLLHYNAALVVSDGLQARMGSLTANQEWFKVWRTIDGEGDAPKTALELEVLVRGVFEPQRFLDLLQHFIVFEEDPDSGALHKIIAGYHQFHAVNAAVEETVRASGMTAMPRARRRGHLLGGPHARRQAGRPSRGRGLAHAGQRQELLDALLRRARGAASGDAEPDAGGADRPQRPRRPAFRPVPALPRHPRPDAGAGRRARAFARAAEPWPAAAWCSPPSTSSCRKRASDARAERAAEHRRHRRRSAPQPVHSAAR
jgi:hypothetical protein